MGCQSPKVEPRPILEIPVKPIHAQQALVQTIHILLKALLGALSFDANTKWLTQSKTEIFICGDEDEYFKTVSSDSGVDLSK